jgi:hypothetical protein
MKTTLNEQGEVKFEMSAYEARATRERTARWAREIRERNEARILAEGRSLDPFADFK